MLDCREVGRSIQFVLWALLPPPSNSGQSRLGPSAGLGAPACSQPCLLDPPALRILHSFLARLPCLAERRHWCARVAAPALCALTVCAPRAKGRRRAAWAAAYLSSADPGSRSRPQPQAYTALPYLHPLGSPSPGLRIRRRVPLHECGQRCAAGVRDLPALLHRPAPAVDGHPLVLAMVRGHGNAVQHSSRVSAWRIQLLRCQHGCLSRQREAVPPAAR